MTAEKPTSRFSRKLTATLSSQRRGSFVSLLALIVFAIAASSTFFVISTRSASMQDQPGTAEATPSAEDLADVREQAIDDEVNQLELEFTELNDSGVEGMVTLYDLDEFTLLAILIEDGGDIHPAHIHEGTCDDLDPQPFAPLSNVTNEEDSLSLVDTPLDELLEGEYSVDLHLSPNELGTLIVCAEIEGTPTPATPAPAATPGTPDAVGGLNQTPEPTEVATETPEPTVTPEPTQTPTPTEVPPTLAAVNTPEPTEEAADVLEDITVDGTGGARDTDMEGAPVSGKGSDIGGTDGTSGVGENGDDRTTTVLTQRAGIGSTIEWTDSPTQAMSLALGTFALVLAGFAVIVRRADRNDGQPPRWNRLGL